MRIETILLLTALTSQLVGCDWRETQNCRRSSDCAKQGKCAWGGDYCVATEEGCAASWLCEYHNQCAAKEGFCVATSELACRKSQACVVEGVCGRDLRGACVATSKGCEESRICQHSGRCTLRTEVSEYIPGTDHAVGERKFCTATDATD